MNAECRMQNGNDDIKSRKLCILEALAAAGSPLESDVDFLLNLNMACTHEDLDLIEEKYRTDN